MKQIQRIALVIILVISYSAQSQIGINTLAPDISAALDIKPKAAQTMGVLVPRTSEGSRLAMTYAGKGLMLYDTTSNMFYVNLTAGTPTWHAINPWATTATNGAHADMSTHTSVNNVGIGVAIPAARLDVNGSIKSNSVVATQTLTANSIVVPTFPVNSLVPTGAIIMWSGTTAPPGWGLCNGNPYVTPNGTINSPDLRGRFIVGYDPALPDYNQPGNRSTPGNTTPGLTGGEEKHTLTKAEIPKHNHQIGNGPDGAVLSYPGNHTHGYSNYEDGSTDNTGNASTSIGYSWQSTGGAGDHSHSGVTGDGTTDGLNTMPHENRPPYYVLAYIIKLP